MNANINPLDIELSSVDLSRPLLAGPSNLNLKIEKAEIVAGTTNTAARMLSLELSTVDPAPSVNGDMLGAGIRIFHRSNLVPVGKLKPEQIVEDVGGLIQSIPGGIPGAKVSNANDWFKQLEGKIVNARVIVEPESSKNGKTYSPRNSISRFNKVK